MTRHDLWHRFFLNELSRPIANRALLGGEKILNAVVIE